MGCCKGRDAYGYLSMRARKQGLLDVWGLDRCDGEIPCPGARGWFSTSSPEIRGPAEALAVWQESLVRPGCGKRVHELSVVGYICRGLMPAVDGDG
jgi:hypothetical protein